jgi:phosphoribosylformylglycinamidine cyclo-ligase
LKVQENKQALPARSIIPAAVRFGNLSVPASNVFVSGSFLCGIKRHSKVKEPHVMAKKISPDRTRAYTEAGVNIEAGNSLVSRIKSLVAQTHTHGVLSDIGGFGGLYKPDIDNVPAPVLVASTDGVGTKLKLAFAWNHHSTVGIDLVAMSVNDILVQGAKPLFFLDYFATGKLDVEVAHTVIAGVAEGCKQAGCALLGGETAEMPDMYSDGEYDLAGFCVGMVSDSAIVDGSSIRVGDRIIGIASSGPHANGYSLIRKILDASGLKGDDIFPGTDRTVRDIFLAPTVIYADCIRNLMRDFQLKGMAHITGGGFYDNIPRALPAQVSASIKFGSWEIPPVFHWLKEQGKLGWPEMLQIFNCGIGYAIIVPHESADEVTRRIHALQLSAWEIGSIEHVKSSGEEQVQIHFPA